MGRFPETRRGVNRLNRQKLEFSLIGNYLTFKPIMTKLKNSQNSIEKDDEKS